MGNALRSWLITAAFSAGLVLGLGVRVTRCQNPSVPNEPPPGSAADRAEDRQEARQLRERTQLDRGRLHADVMQFGKNSPQARADRMQLRADRRALKRLRRDMRRDRRIAERRRVWRQEHRAHPRDF
jgi:hypothetical protein